MPRNKSSVLRRRPVRLAPSRRGNSVPQRASEGPIRDPSGPFLILIFVTELLHLPRPSQPLLQKIHGPLAIDPVRTVEELDPGPVPDAHFIVESPNLGIFVANPLIHANPVT